MIISDCVQLYLNRGICRNLFSPVYIIWTSVMHIQMCVCIQTHIHIQTKASKAGNQTGSPVLYELGLPEPWVSCSYQDLPQWFTKLLQSMFLLLLFWALQLSLDILVDADFLCSKANMLGEMIKERPCISCKVLDLFTWPPMLESTAHVLCNSHLWEIYWVWVRFSYWEI